MPASTYAPPRHFMSIQAEEEALLFYRTWSKIGKAKQRPSCIDFIPDDDLSRSMRGCLEGALQDHDSAADLSSAGRKAFIEVLWDVVESCPALQRVSDCVRNALVDGLSSTEVIEAELRSHTYPDSDHSSPSRLYITIAIVESECPGMRVTYDWAMESLLPVMLMICPTLASYEVIHGALHGPQPIAKVVSLAGPVAHITPEDNKYAHAPSASAPQQQRTRGPRRSGSLHAPGPIRRQSAPHRPSPYHRAPQHPLQRLYPQVPLRALDARTIRHHDTLRSSVSASYAPARTHSGEQAHSVQSGVPPKEAPCTLSPPRSAMASTRKISPSNSMAWVALLSKALPDGLHRASPTRARRP
ncbi:uncharacterized protein SCHCODRAFT_02365748 [Schizophyllum commune H4-8]|uniref:uncharacterized protein n=1 Tax=Schizophyllum commune (strain H4-8 / FGSC 9210) TaxID=578458 RepID=UPI002160D2AF|nr:uncharacterized protein SCHCODRAFT_02365748 [Schizophyllum commune H4-8]KAI5889352.1 hypothetical protein SCHCODRAFT_02365748 [Schizophyllum commune H4-8]